jgi:AcrR family transcriptional regulator
MARGRPKCNNVEVKEKLLMAAEKLFPHSSYQEVTVRDIAKAAEVNPAMINYYFEGKKGLYEAFFLSKYEIVFHGLEQLKNDQNQTCPITHYLQLVNEMVSNSPWFPQFLIHNVLAKDGPMQEFVRKNIAQRIFTVLPTLIQREIHRGRFRSDLDPIATSLSLISLAIFPILLSPLLSPMLQDKNIPFPLLQNHSANVLLNGILQKDNNHE